MVAIGDLSAQQLANARVIFDTAIEFGIEAAKAALMTAGAESSWLRYANNGKSTRADVPVKWRLLAAVSMGFEHDAEAGESWTTADSVWWFQQRAMYGYCDPTPDGIAELCSPECVRIFIRGSHGGKGKTKYFLQSPTNLTLAQRCQWTQGSEFPTGDNYAPFEDVATQLVARFGGVPQPLKPNPNATDQSYLAGLLKRGS